jgi:DNA-binding transcriptional LysR family regulator
MEIKTLYTLLAIVDHRTFADAGKAVNLSASGVSLQVRALEEEFGVTLFDRRTRPPTLTWEGQAFVNRAREVVRGWGNLSESLRREVVSGTLSVGATHTVVSGVLPIALRQLQRKHRDLRVRLMTGLSIELETALERSLIDVAILTEPETVEAEFRYMSFCNEPLAVIAHRSKHGENDRDLLESHSFVRFKKVTRVGQLINEELHRRQINVESFMEVDTLEGVINLVANDLGVSVVPVRRMARPFPTEIKFVPFGNPPLVRALGILQRSENPRAHLVEHLHTELVAATRGPLVKSSLPEKVDR